MKNKYLKKGSGFHWIFVTITCPIMFGGLIFFLLIVLLISKDLQAPIGGLSFCIYSAIWFYLNEKIFKS